MKTTQPLFLFIIFLVISIGMAGCSSNSMQHSTKTRISMQTMDNDITSTIMQLDSTGASLSALIMPDQPDVKKVFEVYTANASKMETMQKRFAKHADEMKTQGKDYFEEWEKDGKNYKNPQIQQLSEQRRAALGDIYGQIAENSVGVKEAFKTYVSDVKEIQQYLSNDLTPKGITAIAPTSMKVVNDGDSLKYAITNVQIAIQRAREAMSQSGSIQ